MSKVSQLLGDFRADEAHSLHDLAARLVYALDEVAVQGGEAVLLHILALVAVQQGISGQVVESAPQCCKARRVNRARGSRDTRC